MFNLMEITDKVFSELPRLEEYKDEFLEIILPKSDKDDRERIWKHQFGYKNVAVYFFDTNSDRITRAEIEFNNEDRKMIYCIRLAIDSYDHLDNNPKLFYPDRLPSVKKTKKLISEDELDIESFYLFTLKSYTQLIR